MVFYCLGLPSTVPPSPILRVPSAKKHIATVSFTPDQGARRVQRMLTQLVADPLAELILSGTLQYGGSAKIGAVTKKDKKGKTESHIQITVE